MKNNKGFAISSVVYAMLILFLGLILLILGNLASRKAMFDKEKNEILSKFNGYDQSVCTPSTSLSNSSAVLVTGDSNKFAIGAEYKCELGDGVSRIFYVLEETSTKVSLIMSENLGSDVAWVSKDDYLASGGTESEYGSLGKVNKGPITLKKTLAERTEGWNKINQAQIKLPTGDQIAKASGLTAWRLSDGYESLLSKNWLFGNLYSTSNTSLSHGYWTSSAYTSTNYSWLVSYTGALTMRYPSADSIVGIRPVIELSKSSFDGPILCTAKTTATTGRVPEGTYAYGDEYTCDLGEAADAKNLTFFVIAKTDTEVSLIMDRNIGATAMWSGDESNHKSDSESSQAITAKSALSSATSNWSKIIKARISLPTEAQISAIYTNTMPTWLYDNLSNSGIMGYWTSSPYSGDTIDAWYVDASGYLIYTSVSNSYGIRPVITISKSQIKTPKSKILCTGKTSATTGNVPVGNYAYGDEYVCELGDGEENTFFVLDTNESNVSLIMSANMNTSGKSIINTSQNDKGLVAWVTESDYISSGGTKNEWDSWTNRGQQGAVTAAKYLKSKNRWSNLTNSQISLPSLSQISKANSGDSGNLPAWLYGNLNTTTLKGYWLSDIISGSPASRMVDYTGSSSSLGGIAWANTTTIEGKATYYGVRPVITISKSQTKTPKIKTYKDGEVVYFDVDNGTKCTSSEAVSTTGTKSGCMKFYAFNDDGGTKVKLLLDHNTTASITWNSDGSNVNGPKEALIQLKMDTNDWKGTETPENYTMDQTGQTSNAKYTIDYSPYKARLITAQEIAEITGNTDWDEEASANSSWYYFDSKTTSASTTCKSGDTSGCKYGWLYDRTSSNCITYGCPNNSDQETSNYWTASSFAGSSLMAWSVSYVSSTSLGNLGSARGLRPVIEVLKSKLA